MPTEFDDQIIYELGVLVATFIFLDQTVTDMWVDLSDHGGPELTIRAQFMPIGFGAKVERLKEKIQERLAGNPAATPIIESACSILDRAAEVAKKRNDVIHGHSFTHKNTGEIYLVNLRKDRTARIRVSQQEISEISDTVSDVALDLLRESSNVRSACRSF